MLQPYEVLSSHARYIAFLRHLRIVKSGHIGLKGYVLNGGMWAGPSHYAAHLNSVGGPVSFLLRRDSGTCGCWGLYSATVQSISSLYGYCR
jgi:hypothetical protein